MRTRTTALAASAMFAAVLMLAVTVRAAEQAPAADPEVARMGSVVLRVSDLRRLLDAQAPEVRRQVAATPELLDRLTRTELFRRVLLNEARASGWDKRPEIAAQMDRAREQLLVNTYIGNLTQAPGSYPSDAEVEALYKARAVELTVPPRKRLAQIFLAADGSGNGTEIGRKAESLSRRAREKDADFATLARTNSQHQESAGQGGDMGWLAEAEMIPELRGVVAGLAPSQVSDPIRSASGWHVVKVVEERPATVRPLASVRGALVASLRRARARENEQRHLDRLAEKTPLSINESALKQLLDKPSGGSRQ